MILKQYVYFISFVLNFIYIFKKFNGSRCCSLFFIFKYFVFILISNTLFTIFDKYFYGISLNVLVLVLIFLVGGSISFISRKYSCIAFSGILTYLLCEFLNVEIKFMDIVFMISFLHILEGIFVLFFLNDESFIYSRDIKVGRIMKIYLPLVINGFPIIFSLFYGREYVGNNCKIQSLISSLLIIFYGIIVLIFGFLVNKYLLLILIPVFHEFIIFIEKLVFLKFRKYIL